MGSSLATDWAKCFLAKIWTFVVGRNDNDNTDWVIETYFDPHKISYIMVKTSKKMLEHRLLVTNALRHSTVFSKIIYHYLKCYFSVLDSSCLVIFVTRKLRAFSTLFIFIIWHIIPSFAEKVVLRHLKKSNNYEEESCKFTIRNCGYPFRRKTKYEQWPSFQHQWLFFGYIMVELIQNGRKIKRKAKMGLDKILLNWSLTTWR